MINPSRLFAVLLALGLLTQPAHAALVAQYDFEGSNANDSSGSTNTYNLAESGTGAVSPTYLSEHANTYVHFAGNNGGADGKALLTATNALETNDDDGNADWIVSLWFRTDDWSQGSFRGIFSTANANGESRGWQLDSNGGAGRVVRNDGGTNTTFLWSSQPSIDEWHHLYLIKNSNSDWELYLDKSLVVSDNTNVGRVDEIRLGPIRNGINSLRMDMDYVQIWDGITDPNSDIDTVYAAGLAHIIPTPAALPAGLALLAALGLRRRRA